MLSAMLLRSVWDGQDKCGLPLATYFSAVKIRWLLDHPTEALKRALEQRTIRFGTVDAWLLWVRRYACWGRRDRTSGRLRRSHCRCPFVQAGRI